MEGCYMVDKFKNDKGTKVFVYGTLMRGNRDHEEFLSESQFAGNYVAEGFQLFDFGSYPRWVLIDMNGNIVQKISGESMLGSYDIQSSFPSEDDNYKRVWNINDLKIK